MSSDAETLENYQLPRHIAIIMDGNGRWAKRRHLPRIAGHKAGLNVVRTVVRMCTEKNIGALTLFAFSSENWRRPPEEVSLLMGLFSTALEQEVAKLHKNNVRLRIIGERNVFGRKLRQQIEEAEQLTRYNTQLNLVIAANYGGRWDLTQAMQAIARQIEQGKLQADDIRTEVLEAKLSLYGLPEPDLFIRTGGEKRISNFLLWQLAYTELYFTDSLWPDFGAEAFDAALSWYSSRQRRFGRTGEQIAKAEAY